MFYIDDKVKEKFNTSDDYFDGEEYVKKIKEAVRNPNIKSIGIYGKWGIGKTSIIKNAISELIDEGDYTDEERIEMGLKFAVRSKKATDNNYLRGVLLYSRDGEYPDTELDKDLEVSSYKWYDEYNFIYSVNDDGIYVYNCATRVNTKLQNIEGEITINEIQNDKIIYNENQEISIIIS